MAFPFVLQTKLSKYEQGRQPPTLEFLARLRAHSGKSIDWIITGEKQALSSLNRQFGPAALPTDCRNNLCNTRWANASRQTTAADGCN